MSGLLTGVVTAISTAFGSTGAGAAAATSRSFEFNRFLYCSISHCHCVKLLVS
jgi:hypothetical protein